MFAFDAFRTPKPPNVCSKNIHRTYWPAHSRMGLWYLSVFLEALSPMQRQLQELGPSLSLSPSLSPSLPLSPSHPPLSLSVTSETNSRTADFTVRHLLYGCVIIYYVSSRTPPLFTGIN